ncbi:MAG: hypothetical protein H0W21_09600, partial [Actinobacteria bacterium]|nr:hypothetical protein [Actinomycetota bacterium]
MSRRPSPSLDVGARVRGSAERAVSAATGDGFEDFLQRVENFRCRVQGNPTVSVDMSCNNPTLGQDFGPDNEIAIAVDPEDPQHLVAGSNDYYYRYNNATGAILLSAPTGFFTSFDGGRHWIDGQIPRGEG